MAKDRTLSKAVKLLDETEDALRRLKVSRKSRGSARELSVKVRIVRDLLEEELARPNTNRWNAVVLIREAAKLVVELLIDNIQYKFRPLVGGHEVLISGTWTRA
ncbi:MAG: hypothetical protein WAP47_03550 [Candidatus Rokuibacteriota bacterium]